MHFRCFFYLQLIVVSYANDADIIHNYFIFKNVSRVVGFSCRNIQDDHEITKVLNGVGIGVSINSLKSVADVSRFLHTDYWNLGIFLDLRCPFAEEDVINLFYETSSYYMFDHLHQWLILGKDMNKTVHLLNDGTFSIVTDVVIAVLRNDDYILYDAYNHCKRCGGLLNITELGIWTKSNGLNITLRTNKFSRRWNYHKMKVKIAGLVAARPKDQSLVDYLREQNNIRTDNWSKFGYSIMAHVADSFNFTYELIELDHWEKDDNNGPLISGLREGIFDMGYFPSILTNERLNYANVMTQVWPVRTCFMFLTIPSLKMDVNIIFRPFTRDVWYIIFLLAVIISLTLYTTVKQEKNATDSDRGTTVLVMIAAFCQQGLPFFGKKFASRVAFLQTMVFGLLVYNYYSAAIVSSRLNVPLDKINDSLFSLVKNKMKLRAYKDIYFNVLLRSSRSDVQYFKKYWATIPEDKKFCSIEDGVKAITKPGFAYHADPNNVYPLIERIFDKQMICQLTEVHLLHPSFLGLWSARHNQFHEITKIGLIRISTSGIRKREVKRWSYRKPYCNKDKHYVSSVTIHEIIPFIFILIWGILLSIVVCLIENVVFRILQEKQKKQNHRLKNMILTNKITVK